MNAFARALGRIFEHRDISLDAVYRPSGAGDGVPCRVILRQPDEMTTFGETQIVRGTTLLEVRVADVAMPRDGDSFTIEARVYRVAGAPRRDVERLTWTCGCRE